uniref:Secreted protein n=1 Tax=Steinernema glaseri TaxID=37863 RepID=A0A1I7ZJM1_9BILA
MIHITYCLSERFLLKPQITYFFIAAIPCLGSCSWPHLVTTEINRVETVNVRSVAQAVVPPLCALHCLFCSPVPLSLFRSGFPLGAP